MDGTAPRDPFTELAGAVQWPDQAAADALRRRGQPGWGRLVEQAEWIAAAQGADPPTPFRRVRLVRVGTTRGPDVGPAHDELLAGEVEVSFDHPDVIAAADAGASLADGEVDGGTDLVIAQWADEGAVPIAVIAALTNTEPVKAMPRGAVLTPEDWMAQAVAVRDLRRIASARRDDPLHLLDALASGGGASAAVQLAGVTGLLLRCAARRTPVLVDGLGGIAAAVLGHHVHAGAGAWWRAADSSPHPAHELALSRLGHRPVLDLQTALPDGSAGVVALAVLRWAVTAASG